MSADTPIQQVERAELAVRITPPWLLGRAARIVERNVMVYRARPLVFLSALVEPILYLFALGVGLGALVGEVTGPGGQPVSYSAFVAPALLAASAMNGAVYESTFNLYSKLKFEHLYDAMLATPVTSRDIAVGETTWALLRGSLYSAAFLAIAAAAGLVTSWWAILAVPAATLIGFAFAGVAMTATTFMTSWQDFDLVQLVLMPLFLFSATFYPLDVYPSALQAIVVLSPLYHGVELVRGLMLGVIGPGLLVHVAVLVGLGLVGVRFAARRLDTLLVR
ncbi:MAG: ABC transporter [Nitriliruptor sp.]|nr:MAG: ABC transporter [Nitriliruptor sp.]